MTRVADRVTQVSAPQPEVLTRDIASIGYLRAFVTLLVLAHHAVVAYHPLAPPPTTSLVAEPWWKAFPVVDPERSVAWLLFTAFNDVFFMSLLFFVSGLFVWRSLERKGARVFLRDRALRLGLPFAVAATVLAPIAYYPAYLVRSAEPTVADFWSQWLMLGEWPAGPAWFLWLLLAFNLLVAALYWMSAGLRDTLDRLRSSAFQRPAVFLAVLVGISAAAYLPMVLIFGPLRWDVAGPFTFQTSRLLLYAVYFLGGVLIGGHGVERGLLSPGGPLARRWLLWVLGALAAFALLSVVTVLGVESTAAPQAWTAVGGVGFVLSCAASSFALLAIFPRFVQRRGAVRDSLRANAYGLYIVHYAFASWLQYSLLSVSLGALAKGTLVFLGTLALSWATVALIRRIPAVAQVI